MVHSSLDKTWLAEVIGDHESITISSVFPVVPLVSSSPLGTILALFVSHETGLGKPWFDIPAGSGFHKSVSPVSDVTKSDINENHRGEALAN